MTPSVLQLDDYVFTNISINCVSEDPAHSAEPVIKRENLKYSVQVFDNVDNSVGKWRVVRFQIDNSPDDCSTSCYKFNLDALARFSYNVEVLEETGINLPDPERILVRNAANIMYGIMREKLRSATATMVYGPLVLPLVTFEGLTRRVAKTEESSESHKTKGGSTRQKSPRKKTPRAKSE